MKKFWVLAGICMLVFSTVKADGNDSLPSCSAPVVWNDDETLYARLECRKDNKLEDLFIVTENADDPPLVSQAKVTDVTKFGDTVNYLQLSGNVGMNTPTTLYVCSEIPTATNPDGTVQGCSASNGELKIVTAGTSPITSQEVVYDGRFTVKSDTPSPGDFNFNVKSKDYSESKPILKGEDYGFVFLDTYQPEHTIYYDIIPFDLKADSSVYGIIKGYSLTGQTVSNTTIEVSWINHHKGKEYPVQDSHGAHTITVECSNDKHCYGYFIDFQAPIDDTFTPMLTIPTEPPVTTTITGTKIPSSTKATEVPQLTLLTFHRTDEETMEVCFEDADPPIITDTTTEHKVTFTFTINGMEQLSRTAKNLKTINNTFHCASFDVTGQSEFTESFSLVGQLSIHDQNDLQINIATGFTSFQMPGSTEIPSCSSAAILKNDVEPFVIVECRENDELDGLTIVTASEDDPISFLEADVITAAKIVDNTTYYLGLNANVGSNTPTKLYISKEITVSPPLSGTVHVYSGPVDELYLIDPIENPTAEQAVVYDGSLTLTFGQPLTDNMSFIFASNDESIIQKIPTEASNVEVNLTSYVIDQDITYLIYDSAAATAASATIKGYSLKGQALSNTTVEFSWINCDQYSNYTVEDSTGNTAITVECSDDDYCYGYFTNLPLSIGEEYKATLKPPTEPPLTTITSATIPPFTEAIEVPQLTLLAFHRKNETTLEVCFEDAETPIIPDTPTADQVTFTFTINEMEQHSRTAFELKIISNALVFHCSSFDVTDLSEFTEEFALVGQLSVHDPNDPQTTIATIFTSFQMPGSMEIPECSSAAVWNDDEKPIAIVECRENDSLDDLTIITASASDQILFLQAVVNRTAPIVDNTTYYLDLSTNVGSNNATALYISKEITVSTPLNGTVQVYSGPTDEFTLITPMANPTTEQAVVYDGSLTLTFDEPLTDNMSFIFESNNIPIIQTIAANETYVEVNLTSYVIDQDISYLIYDSAANTSATATIKGYSLKGQALSDTKVEVSWINCDQNSDYIVEDSTGSTTITVECGADDYCYGYFTNLSPQIGDEYRATLTPTAVTPITTITSMIISPVTKDIEIHVQEVHLDWSNDLRMVETEICFQHTSTAHYTNEAAFDYEGVIVNNQGEWRRGQGLGMDSDGNSCLKPLILNTESFSVRGEMMVIVLKRAKDGRTVLASGETRMFFHK